MSEIIIGVSRTSPCSDKKETFVRAQANDDLQNKQDASHSFNYHQWIKSVGKRNGKYSYKKKIETWTGATGGAAWGNLLSFTFAKVSSATLFGSPEEYKKVPFFELIMAFTMLNRYTKTTYDSKTCRKISDDFAKNREGILEKIITTSELEEVDQELFSWEYNVKIVFGEARFKKDYAERKEWIQKQILDCWLERYDLLHSIFEMGANGGFVQFG